MSKTQTERIAALEASNFELRAMILETMAKLDTDVVQPMSQEIVRAHERIDRWLSCAATIATPRRSTRPPW